MVQRPSSASGTGVLIGMIGASHSPNPVQPDFASDSAAAANLVEKFHAALVDGDSSAIAFLLDTAVVVLDAGNLENRASYLRDCLSADIAFAQAVPTRRMASVVTVQENAAWVSTTYIVRGRFNGRPVNCISAELMVLSRARAGARWRIRAIHRSSRRTD